MKRSPGVWQGGGEEGAPVLCASALEVPLPTPCRVRAEGAAGGGHGKAHVLEWQAPVDRPAPLDWQTPADWRAPLDWQAPRL